MTRREKKSELTARIRATTESGEEVQIEERTDFIRESLLAGGWTPWLSTTRHFSMGRIPVNLLDDGSFETAEFHPRRLTPRE